MKFAKTLVTHISEGVASFYTPKYLSVSYFKKEPINSAVNPKKVYYLV